MDTLKTRLPIAGILAFALASTWALYQLFNGAAQHPTALYLVPAVAVEIVSAWLVAQTVRYGREALRSIGKGTSKQDRRFYRLVTALLIVLVLPTLAASAVANAREFGGSVLLGLLFPATCVGCAIGAVVPEVVAKRTQKPKSAPVPVVTGQPELVTAVRPDDNGHGRMSYDKFVELVPDVSDMSGQQVAELANVTERTGRRWLTKRGSGL